MYGQTLKKIYALEPRLRERRFISFSKFLKITSVGILAASFNIQAFATELVTNGKMANGGASWLRFTKGTSADINTLVFPAGNFPLIGTNTLDQMVVNTYETGANPWSNTLYQPVSLKPNTKYRLIFSARSVSGNPADIFVRVFQGSDPADYKAATFLTRRIRTSIDPSKFVIDFEIGDTVSGKNQVVTGPFTLAFSGRSNMTYNVVLSRNSVRVGNSVLGGQVGITDVSLFDNPPDMSGNILSGQRKTTIDVNQAGYMGKNKPFIFTITNLPQDVKLLSATLKRQISPNSSTNVAGKDGQPIRATILSSTNDLESNNQVITLSIDSSSPNFPDNLSDDLQDSNKNPITFGRKFTGYFIEADILGSVTVCSGTFCHSEPRGASVDSQNFPISKNIYSKLMGDALNYFYYNTAGKSVSMFPAGTIDDPAKSEQSRAAGHTVSDTIATCRSGKDAFGNDFTNGCYVNGTDNSPILSMDVHGGWYDAGDQGKYVVNGGVALWTLQNMIERMEKKADSLTSADTTAKDALTLKISQLLQVAKEEMDFMLRMQAPAGTNAMVPDGYQGGLIYDSNGKPTKEFGYYQTDLNTTPNILDQKTAGAINYRGGHLPRLGIKLKLTKQDVSNMVFHSVTDANWTILPTAPADDVNYRVLTYPTSAATFNMAAVAAQAFRIWSWPGLPQTTVPHPLISKAIMSQQDYADLCLTKGFAAYQAAKTRYNLASTKSGSHSLYRYEYSNDDWHQVDAGSNTVSLNGKSYTDAGPNFTWLASGFSLQPEWLGGGAYGDYRVLDEYYWASMEMFLSSTHSQSHLVIDDLQTNKTITANQAFGEFLSFVPSGNWKDSDASSGIYSKFTDAGFPVSAYSWIKGFDWQNVAPLGTLSALTASSTFSSGASELQKDTVSFTNPDNTVFKTSYGPKANLISMANTLVGYTNSQAYQFAKLPIKKALAGTVDQSKSDLINRDYQYEWGSNGNIVNRAIILAIAQDITQNSANTYANAAALSMDYILGRNANGISYVTGYGFNSARNPHHRFWAKLMDPNYPSPPDGVLLGGPNSRDISAVFANADFTGSTGTLDNMTRDDKYYFLKNVVIGNGCLNNFDGGTSEVFAPQKCFLDNPHSFASSEVAINWNAPLGWITQYLNDYAQK